MKPNILSTKRFVAASSALMLTVPAIAGESGKMTREVWNSIPGSAVSVFTDSPRYWQTADSVSTVSGAAGPLNAGTDFAARYRTYVTAPTTGSYTFWIASDNSSELRLSSTSSKFGRVAIASVSGWVDPQAWDAKTSQKSATIALVAGQRYFMEALHKEDGGGDHLAIAWKIPGGSRVLIPASALESFTTEPDDVDNDELSDTWEATYGFSLTDNGTVYPGQHPLADPDHDGFNNLAESKNGTNPNAHGGVPGLLTLETWNNISGTTIEDFIWSKRFTGAPDKSEFIASAETPINRGDNFVARMRGYVTAPTTGTYTFYVAGDDFCQLSLSTTSSQFAKTKIAYTDGWARSLQWTKYPTQKSVAIPLVAGQKYHIEAILKETSSGDHLEIGWKLPGSSTIDVIPGSALESHAQDLNDADGDGMPDDWEVVHHLNPAVNDSALDPDGDGIANHLENRLNSDPEVRNSVSGGLAVELWSNISDYSTRSLVANKEFYAPAQSLSVIVNSTTGKQLVPANYFATRSRGYIIAPATGDYRFWISGRNGLELYLSTDATKYAKRKIAEINPEIGGGHGISYDDSNRWDHFASQQSAVVYLVKDQVYYLETLQANGHVQEPHVSLAWAPPGGARVAISSACFRSYLPEAADADDDYLPDAWEQQYGLDIADNGYIDILHQGERGDLDGDGLSNREEYLLGTIPADSDTDGDGESDGDEVNALGTNALVANAITDTFLSEVALGGFTSSSTGWTMTTGGLLADSFRGEVSWDFTVPSDGNWLVRLEMELMGTSYGNEDVPVVVKVDGVPVTRRDVRFGLAKRGLLQGLTPWLVAGSHQITVLVDNEIARRTVRIVALKIYAPANAPAILARDNRLIAHPANTRTSPAFIEGFARNPITVTVNGIPAINGTGGGHWFANVPLADQSTAQSYSLSYEQGWGTSGTLTWQATNVMDAETLTLRQGDSLRVGAWGVNLAMTSSVTLSSGGSWSFTGDQTAVIPFNTSGTFSINGTLQSGTTANLVVKVIPAPGFTSGTIDVLENAGRTLSIPAAQEVGFSVSEAIGSLAVVRSAPNTNVTILAGSAEEFGLAARLFGGGPILAIQRVNVISVSDALQNDLTSSEASAIAGYKLLTTPITILNLPSGGRVDVSIIRAGVMFLNGSTLKSIYPADIVNGVVNVEFLYPLGQSGGYCHSLLVYDRNGILIGGR